MFSGLTHTVSSFDDCYLVATPCLSFLLITHKLQQCCRRKATNLAPSPHSQGHSTMKIPLLKHWRQLQHHLVEWLSKTSFSEELLPQYIHPLRQAIQCATMTNLKETASQWLPSYACLPSPYLFPYCLLNPIWIYVTPFFAVNSDPLAACISVCC